MTAQNNLQQLRDALADRYRIEGELGRGGMATVYLAEDLRHHRRPPGRIEHLDGPAYRRTVDAVTTWSGHPRKYPRPCC